MASCAAPCANAKPAQGACRARVSAHARPPLGLLALTYRSSPPPARTLPPACAARPGTAPSLRGEGEMGGLDELEEREGRENMDVGRKHLPAAPRTLLHDARQLQRGLQAAGVPAEADDGSESVQRPSAHVGEFARKIIPRLSPACAAAPAVATARSRCLRLRSPLLVPVGAARRRVSAFCERRARRRCRCLIVLVTGRFPPFRLSRRDGFVPCGTAGALVRRLGLRRRQGDGRGLRGEQQQHRPYHAQQGDPAHARRLLRSEQRPVLR